MADYGVPGLTARHIWTDAAGRTLTLNDAERDLSLGARFVLDPPIAGLHARADREIKSEPARSRRGQVRRHSTSGGKTVTYQGHVEAPSFPTISRARRDFDAAFGDDEMGAMLIAPHPSDPEAPPSYTYKAEVLAAEVVEDHASSQWRWPFTLGLHMYDPRFFEVTELLLETAALFTSHAALNLWSFTTSTPAWSTQSLALAIPYAGRAEGDPVIDLYGPVTAPRVANELAKTGLRFHEWFVIAAGQFLRIDFGTREVLLNIGGIFYDYDIARNSALSDWWDKGVPGLVPGVTQTLRYGGKTQPGGKMVVRWRNASYG